MYAHAHFIQVRSSCSTEARIQLHWFSFRPACSPAPKRSCFANSDLHTERQPNKIEWKIFSSKHISFGLTTSLSLAWIGMQMLMNGRYKFAKRYVNTKWYLPRFCADNNTLACTAWTAMGGLEMGSDGISCWYVVSTFMTSDLHTNLKMHHILLEELWNPDMSCSIGVHTTPVRAVQGWYQVLDWGAAHLKQPRSLSTPVDSSSSLYEPPPQTPPTAMCCSIPTTCPHIHAVGTVDVHVKHPSDNRCRAT